MLWNSVQFVLCILCCTEDVIRSFLVIIVITKQYTGPFLGNIETLSINVLYIHVPCVNIMLSVFQPSEFTKKLFITVYNIFVSSVNSRQQSRNISIATRKISMTSLDIPVKNVIINQHKTIRDI